MDHILAWGLNVIAYLGKLHTPFLDKFFYAATELGSEGFYLVLIPALLWCVDFAFTARLSVLFIFSVYFNFCFKNLLRQPRPFDLVPDITTAREAGYGIPSGHSQSSLVVWVMIASYIKKTWFWILAILIILLIAFSRLYLGVHFPTDVLGGWVLGGILLLIYFLFHDKVERWLSVLKLGMQVFLAFLIPLVFIFIHPVKETVAAMAVLSGAGTGLAFMYRYVGFKADGMLIQKILRFLVGILTVFIIYYGLKYIFPEEEHRLYLLFRFIRYWVIGIWVILGAPYLFKVFKLADKG
ncbi:MAG: phosphatase PAP2 family protein [Armatimonadota bacterium]